MVAAAPALEIPDESPGWAALSSSPQGVDHW